MVTVLFKTMTLVGSEWVMWILVALSVVCVAMILERMRVIRSQETLGAKLWKDHIDPLMTDPQKNDLKAKAAEIASTYPCVEGQLLELIEKNPMSRGDLQLVIQSFLGREKLKLEKHLAFLGTIGSNAPFIGLFGTVLGIIKAFHDLGTKVESAGAQTVNMGLSEALVATAVGLLVAIPAVLFYNYFQKKIKSIMGRSESLSNFLLSLK